MILDLKQKHIVESRPNSERLNGMLMESMNGLMVGRGERWCVGNITNPSPYAL